MIKQTLLEIRTKIENSTSIDEGKKTELLNLLSVLQSEIDQLSTTDLEKLPLHKSSLEGFAASVSGFEESHPRLVETVNAICTALSNLGI